LDQVMSCELVFKGQGADFMQREELETVRRVQRRFVESICSDTLKVGCVDVLVDIANNKLIGKPGIEEDVRTCVLYLLNGFLRDLNARYPYELEERGKVVLQRRLYDFAAANLFNRYGTVVLNTAAEAGTPLGSVWKMGSLLHSTRRWLGAKRRKIRKRNEERAI
jgi:hypothetical protein